MTAPLRILRLLAVVVWVGGLVFFAFVVAPVAFSVLPSTHMAGTVVAGTLGVLHWIALACGLVFLAAAAVLRARSSCARGLISAQLWLVLAMIAASAAIQWRIVPAMERDRLAAGGEIDAAPREDPARLDFERLHPLSERLEGAVLLAGLAVVVLIGLERSADAGARRTG
ncbi:MAG: DUF4149 domain-containing protein [Acidobacteriota bacterium]|nr:DUF4149 domain-containing protein [Acidobacteriota bacterium]